MSFEDMDPMFRIGMLLGNAYGNVWANNATKRQEKRADRIFDDMQNANEVARIAQMRNANIADETATDVVADKLAQQAGTQGAQQATGMNLGVLKGVDYLGQADKYAQPQEQYQLSVPSPLEQLKASQVGGKDYSVNKALQANQKAIQTNEAQQAAMTPQQRARANFDPTLTATSVRRKLRDEGIAKDVIDERMKEYSQTIAEKARAYYQPGILKDMYYGVDVSDGKGGVKHIPPNAATMASALEKIQEYAKYDPDGAQYLAKGIISPKTFFDATEESRKYARNRADKLADDKSNREFQLSLENSRQSHYLQRQQYAQQLKRNTLIRALAAKYPNATPEQLARAADLYLLGNGVGSSGSKKSTLTGGDESTSTSKSSSKTEYGGTKYKQAIEESKDLEAIPEEERTPEQSKRLKTLKNYISVTGEEAIPSPKTQQESSNFVGGLLKKGYTPSDILAASGYAPGSDQFNTLYDSILNNSGASAGGNVSPDQEFTMPTNSGSKKATVTSSRNTNQASTTGYPAPINYAYNGDPVISEIANAGNNVADFRRMEDNAPNYPSAINYAYNGDPDGVLADIANAGNNVADFKRAQDIAQRSEPRNYPAPINYAYNGDPDGAVANIADTGNNTANYPSAINYAYNGDPIISEIPNAGNNTINYPPAISDGYAYNSNPPDTSSSRQSKRDYGSLSDTVLDPAYWNELWAVMGLGYNGEPESKPPADYIYNPSDKSSDNVRKIAEAKEKPSGGESLTNYYSDLLDHAEYELNEGYQGIRYGTSGLVNRMRDACGIIPHYDTDGTNCARTVGAVLKNTPYAGMYNVDQFIDEAKKAGELYKADSGYKPKAGDLAVTDNGDHIVMVTENGGTIQNGTSRNGVYEVKKSPEEQNGGVLYYIRTSDYEGQFPNFHFNSGLGDFDIAGASQILEDFLLRGA